MENKIVNNKIIFSIETSGKVCSVALAKFNSDFDLNSELINYELISEYSINIGNKHDKYCAELCKRILQDNDCEISNIDCVVVSTGPGSFTGLRIGVAVAKGICFDLNNEIPLIAVPTLSALSNNAVPIANLCNEASKILAIIPSHSNLVYHQFFDKKGNKISDIELIDLQTLAQKHIDENLIITTNSLIKINFGIHISHLFYITASSIARLGAKMYLNNEFTNSIDIHPLYIQDFIPK